METLKNTIGIPVQQLKNGTPSDKKIVLKSFYKDDRCTISPTKDINGRYLGINENIPEIKKLEMGYVPSIDSRIKLFDGMVIDLNNKTQAADWEWMQHCVEISDNFEEGQSNPGAYFYVYRPGFESQKKVTEAEKRFKLMNYILTDSPENLYNRASILGVDMSSSNISDVKEYLLSLIEIEPHKITAVYESKTFALELLLLHAVKKDVIKKRNGVYIYGEVLLGGSDKDVIAYFSNPKNSSVTRAVESATYANVRIKNPLENEAVQDSYISNQVDNDYQESVKENTLEKEASKDDSKKELTPQEKAAITRRKNAENKAKK